MNERLKEVVDDNFIDVDKNKCSIYYYLISIDNFLCKFQTWKILRGKTDDSKFNFITNVIMKYYDISSLYEIPDKLLDIKTSLIETELISLIKSFDNSIKKYNNFCKTVSHYPIKKEDLFNYIDQYKVDEKVNSNKIIFDNILTKFYVNTNNYLDIRTAIKKYLINDSIELSKEPKLITKCLLYILDDVIEIKNDTLTKNKKSFINHYFKYAKYSIDDYIDIIMKKLQENYDIKNPTKSNKIISDAKKIIVKKKYD
jgi:hypothetical protein